jgi:tyrosyl-DNA phosphodiesterase-1
VPSSARAVRALFTPPSSSFQCSHVFLFNFMIDPLFLLHEALSCLGENLENVSALLICDGAHYDGPPPASMNGEGSAWNLELVSMPQGASFHGKLGLSFFKGQAGEEVVRVVVTTANFVPSDWSGALTQAVWQQDFALRRELVGPEGGSGEFEGQVVEYLRRVAGAVQTAQSRERVLSLAQRLYRFDFCAATVDLVSSVPFQASGPEESRFGAYRLRELLERRGVRGVAGDILVLQFSSFSSFSLAWLKWFVECVAGVDTARDHERRVKIVYPTVQQVKESPNPNGYGLPSRGANSRKPFLRPMMCGWSTSARTKTTPHIKSYGAFFRDAAGQWRARWYLVTSANLSRAAWGLRLASGASKGRYAITSFELGVLFTNRANPAEGLEILTSPNQNPSAHQVLVPFAVPPRPYTDTDVAFAWEAPSQEAGQAQPYNRKRTQPSEVIDLDDGES